jgi:mono/diheme cytochrome c family protein
MTLRIVGRNLGRLVLSGLGLGCFLLTAGVRAETGEEPVDYLRQILPIFSQNCFTCHGPDEDSREAGLRLDQVEGALAELDSGRHALVPGEPSRSELWRRLTSDDEFQRMPPGDSGRTLTEEQMETVRRWIRQGAPYADHWAFLPPERPVPPDVQNSNWPRNEIDYFVLARLEQLGISPSGEADRTTLIRRLSLDLLGLLPSLEEVAAFVQDPRPDAYEQLVERLLASPHFGERWGKHWLDLARYADSDGYLGDPLRPHAYRYRDWVIAAINQDQPFDQFTVEQLAGDLLPDATLEQKIATGFHRNAMKNTEAGADREEDRVHRMVNYVSTTGTVWLGLTIGCAECHTHKYDPISHREFYEMYAFFNNTEEFNLPAPEEAPTIAELETSKRRPTRIHLRGDFRNPGDEVTPGTLAVLHPLESQQEWPNRLDLAHWLVNPQNPLTHRVTANHIWKHLFGRGLVSTTDNMGTTGEAPSHPELLDWLALELVERNWSRKAMIRLIVCSATYRQASHVRRDLRGTDPHNVWLARQARFRLEAEGVRDVALFVAGLLNPTIGGPSIRPPLAAQVTNFSRNKDWPVSPGWEKYRRGLYILFRRNTPYSMLITFDAPDTSVACTQRERSNSPLQALTLLNDEVFFEAAQHLGRRMMASHGGQAAETENWVRETFRLCLSRDPNPEELQRLIDLYWEQLELLDEVADEEIRSLVGVPMEGVDLRDQAARVIVARSLMNVHEFITRE